MKKMSYKHVVIILTIISVALLIIVKNEPIDQYIKNIMISLSINIISSIVIIFMIDIKKENDTKRQIAERRRIIYKSLVSPIRDYNCLIYNLYKATTKKEKINIEYFTTENLNAENIFKNITLLDINKNGYIYDIYKKRSMLWKEVIANSLLSYIKSLKEFYNINSQYIDNDLSELLYKIISNEKTKNFCEQILYLNIDIKTDDLLKILNIKEIFLSTKQIEKNISQYINIDELKVENSTIMVENISPKFGSGIKSK